MRMRTLLTSRTGRILTFIPFTRRAAIRRGTEEGCSARSVPRCMQWRDLTQTGRQQNRQGTPRIYANSWALVVARNGRLVVRPIVLAAIMLATMFVLRT